MDTGVGRTARSQLTWEENGIKRKEKGRKDTEILNWRMHRSMVSACVTFLDKKPEAVEAHQTETSSPTS